MSRRVRSAPASGSWRQMLAALILFGAAACSDRSSQSAAAFERFVWHRDATNCPPGAVCVVDVAVDGQGRITYKRQKDTFSGALNSTELQGLADFLRSEAVSRALSGPPCGTGKSLDAQTYVELAITGRPVLKKDIDACGGQPYVELERWVGELQTRAEFGPGG